MKNLRTQKQQEILTNLSTNFRIDGTRVLFINARDENDPWIPSDELESIARQLNGYKHSSVLHDKYIAETKQVAYVATVETSGGTIYNRSGVAMIGERTDIDADTLAAGRALGAALRAAGFHPYRSGSVVDFAEMRQEIEAKRIMESIPQAVDETAVRAKDLRQIHAIAVEKKLIVGKDYSIYRNWLFVHYGFYSAVMLDAAQRQSVINALNLFDDESFLDEIPVDLRAEAMVA